MFIGFGTVARLEEKQHEIGVNEVQLRIHTNAHQSQGRRNEHEKTEQAEELTAVYRITRINSPTPGTNRQEYSSFSGMHFPMPIIGPSRKLSLGLR